MGFSFDKGALFSRGVLGGLIALVPALDNLAVMLKIFEVPMLGPAVAGVASVAGAVLAIYGRVKAKGKIVGII